ERSASPEVLLQPDENIFSRQASHNIQAATAARDAPRGRRSVSRAPKNPALTFISKLLIKSWSNPEQFPI
ncbi:hypothetical protein, partial [Pseudomonas sp. UBA6699]|uniref:hypothetical protein n=1 Tax=Pseudomonas sp. UBA6699 TaxID=1947333 RepID=UPI00257DF664